MFNQKNTKIAAKAAATVLKIGISIAHIVAMYQLNDIIGIEGIEIVEEIISQLVKIGVKRIWDFVEKKLSKKKEDKEKGKPGQSEDSNDNR